MARYFLHIDEGNAIVDGEGVELPDFKAARREAIRACGEMLREVPATLFDGKPWRLWITDGSDGTGKTLFSVSVSVSDG